MSAFLIYFCLLPAVVLMSLPGSAAELVEVRREKATGFDWTKDESAWIRERCGIIFYGEGTPPFYSQCELIDMAHALGFRSVKTWLKGFSEGEMARKLAAPDYVRLLGEFDTVLLDVCPEFVKGDYDDAKSALMRKEYSDVAYALASGWRGSPKTFLLSLFMEANLFFGTPRAHLPEFPVDRFFADAEAGVRDGISRAAAEPGKNLPHIYTVIEVAGRPVDFIRRYLPGTTADLYAISYYGRGELGQEDVTLEDCIAAVSEAAHDNGPFGRDNLILGELGRNVFAGGNDGDDREQLDYLRRTLATARKHNLRHAFVFWLADQERHLDDGWGFVSSIQTGSRLRRSWHAFQQLLGGRMPAVRPARPMPEIGRVCPGRWNPSPGEAVSLEVDLANRSAWNGDARALENAVVTITPSGGEPASLSLKLAPDEVVTLRGPIDAPTDGKVSVSLRIPDSESVEQTVSLNRADVVVDRIYTEPEHPRAGDEVTFFATVRNTGKVAITDFNVQFHVDDFRDLWVTWGCIYGDTRLAPGQSLPIGGGFKWKATSGAHRVRAWANADGSREADYSNNILWTDLAVD